MEVVIIVPVMMLLVLAAIQATLVVEANDVVQAAASVGSEVAAGFESSAPQGRAAASSYLSEHGRGLVSEPAIAIAESRSGSVTVEVTARAVGILSFMGLTVSATRSEPIQEYRESG